MEIQLQLQGDDAKMVPQPETKQWTIRTWSGIVLPIANFQETYQKETNTPLDLNSIKWWGNTPYVELTDETGYLCDLTSSRWVKYLNWVHFTTEHHCNIINILVHENMFLATYMKRVQKLEAIFDHIRQKSSLLDEFIKIAESAVNE